MSDKKLLIGIVLLVAATVISFHAVEVYAAIAMVPVDMFGSGLNGNSNFTFPDSVAVDSKGNVFVVDQGNNRIQKFFPNGTHMLTFGNTGTGLGQLNFPESIAIDSSDNVWVAELFNDRIQKFNENGSALLTFGGTGSTDGFFMSPIAIAINSTDHVFVADQNNNRIQIFNNLGQHLLSVGGFADPSAIAINGSSHIFVLDGNDITIFDDEGTSLKTFTPASTPLIFEIAIDSSDNIYVADAANSANQVIRYDSNFENPSAFGSTGGGDGEFADTGPTGVAVDSSGNIYVSDFANHRFQRFDNTLTYQYTVGANKTEEGGMDSPLGIVFLMVEIKGWEWASIRPGSRVASPRSITRVRSSISGMPPTATIRSPSTTSVASCTGASLRPSISLALRNTSRSAPATGAVRIHKAHPSVQADRQISRLGHMLTPLAAAERPLAASARS